MMLQEFFLKQKEAIRARSRDVFTLLRAEHMDWKPEKGALSVGDILRHLWTSEVGVRQCALEGNFAYYETRIPKGLREVMGMPATLEEELRNIERVHGETLTAVANRPGDLFDEERANPGLGFRRKVAVILFGVNEHEIHHRAQLMTYLRMLGTPAPEPFKKPKS
jgi:DinB family protein